MGRAEEDTKRLEPLELRKALEIAGAEIARLERDLLELERLQLEAQSELAAAVAELTAARRRADELEAAQVRAAAELSELGALREREARLRELLGSVLESRSWRLTRPLRALRGSTRPEADRLEQELRGG